MATVIAAEGLGKYYTIRHEQANHYQTLRDSLVDSVRNVMKPRQEARETFWALRDVGFELQQGDRLGVIGRNGAGKSTLLKLLSRITEPSEGRVRIKGRVACLLEVGAGFHQELSGRENIFLNGAIMGMSNLEIRKKLDEIVAFAEVEKFLDTPVKRYSSGMYTRLAFSVAAHLEADILVVDEVLSVGDAAFQEKCLQKADEFGRSGRTVLFVSHNLTSIKSLCNKGLFLEDGGLRMSGGLDEVVEAYSKSISTGAEGGFSAWRTRHLEVLDISLCDERGARLQYIDTDTPISIRIRYRLLQRGRLGFVLQLRRDGQTILKTISNFDSTFNNVKDPGEYESVCQIPGMFLNNGFHTISLSTFQGGYLDTEHAYDILAFEVADGAGVRNGYFGPYGGAVRPQLAWHTRQA